MTRQLGSMRSRVPDAYIHACVHEFRGMAADTRSPAEPLKRLKRPHVPIRHSAMFTSGGHRERAADTIDAGRGGGGSGELNRNR